MKKFKERRSRGGKGVRIILSCDQAGEKTAKGGF